jgi:hypothetical protein
VSGGIRNVLRCLFIRFVYIVPFISYILYSSYILRFVYFPVLILILLILEDEEIESDLRKYSVENKKVVFIPVGALYDFFLPSHDIFSIC